jgi:lysophospholipase L1-like esterase
MRTSAALPGTFLRSWLAVAAIGILAATSPAIARKHSYHEFRLEVFAISRIKTAAIVMLGDSITEAAPWDELTGCRSIVNRGIGGDTTAGVLARLDEVAKLQPRAVFLMIGVNDISLGVPADKTIENYRAILDRLNAANIRTFAAYVLPVAKSYSKPQNNAVITRLNEAIAVALRGRSSTVAIDLRPLLRGADGYLREDLTYDGLHLSGKGYAIWRDAIAAPVAELCTPY